MYPPVQLAVGYFAALANSFMHLAALLLKSLAIILYSLLYSLESCPLWISLAHWCC